MGKKKAAKSTKGRRKRSTYSVGDGASQSNDLSTRTEVEDRDMSTDSESEIGEKIKIDELAEVKSLDLDKTSASKPGIRREPSGGKPTNDSGGKEEKKEQPDDNLRRLLLLKGESEASPMISTSNYVPVKPEYIGQAASTPSKSMPPIPAEQPNMEVDNASTDQSRSNNANFSTATQPATAAVANQTTACRCSIF